MLCSLISCQRDSLISWADKAQITKRISTGSVSDRVLRTKYKHKVPSAVFFCDECGWNYMPFKHEDPGSNPGGSKLCGVIAQLAEHAFHQYLSSLFLQLCFMGIENFIRDAFEKPGALFCLCAFRSFLASLRESDNARGFSTQRRKAKPEAPQRNSN